MDEINTYGVDGGLTRLHRAQDAYEKIINTPDARWGISIVFLQLVGGELTWAVDEIRAALAEVDRLNTELARARAEVEAMRAWKDLALMREGRDD